MLTATGRSSVDGIDAEYVESWMFHPAFRIFTTLLRGGVLDEAVLGEKAVRRRAPRTPRSGVVLVTSGEVLLRTRGRATLLRAGDAALVQPGRVSVRMQAAGTAPCAVTSMDWVIGRGGGVNPSEVEVARLSKSTLVVVDELRLAARMDETERATGAIGSLLESLRSEGLPLERMTVAEIGVAQPDVLQRLLRCFAHAASQPGSSAGMTDLVDATGRSPRQVGRLIGELGARFDMASGGYRDASLRSRVHLGSMFMTANRATTEAVAKFLGYSDPTSYCRVHAELGLPSPGELARAVRIAT